MLPGVYLAHKKDNSIYYRSNITYRSKHISLGSFQTEADAHKAYEEALFLLEHPHITLENSSFKKYLLSFEKIVVLLNFRDSHLYLPNPIYLKKGYFIYYLSRTDALTFDIDDLFYYTNHKIIRRQGHLFVNDFGMQVTILSRYGIKAYAVADRDYRFVNGDSKDFRYSNIEVINPYYGVSRIEKNGVFSYKTQIHINGNYTIGTYRSLEKAAIAYNKAVDLAKKAGVSRNFQENYIDTMSPRDYADIYTKVKISRKYLDYLKGLPH